MKEANLTSDKVKDSQIPRSGRLYSGPLPRHLLLFLTNFHLCGLKPHNRTASALFGPLI